ASDGCAALYPSRSVEHPFLLGSAFKAFPGLSGAGMKFWLLLAAWAFSLPLQAQLRGKSLGNTEKTPPAENFKVEEKSAWRSSLAPIVGLDDRSGGRIGAAAYLYTESEEPGSPG